MKNLVDLFVAKDRTTTFWFVMACAAILSSGIYVKTIVSKIAVKPQYVMMDGNGIYYLAPSLEFNEADELHIAQTKLAMDAIFTRGPRGLEREGLLRQLSLAKVVKQVETELAKDAKFFKDQSVTQTVVVQEARALPQEKLKLVATGVDPHTAKLTFAKGLLTRTKTLSDKTETETYEITVNFIWVLNPRIASETFGPFPSLLGFVKFGDPVKVEEP